MGLFDKINIMREVEELLGPTNRRYLDHILGTITNPQWRGYSMLWEDFSAKYPGTGGNAYKLVQNLREVLRRFK